MRDLFLFFGQMSSGSMYNFSFCFYSNGHLFWGILFPQTPSDSDQTLSLLLKGLCCVCSHGPTAHMKSRIMMDTNRFPVKTCSHPSQNRIFYGIFLQFPHLCPWLHPLLSLISSSTAALGSPLSFSPHCISSCPQPLIHSSHLWSSDWEQVGRQMTV